MGGPIWYFQEKENIHFPSSVNPKDFQKYMPILTLPHKRNILISLLLGEVVL